MKICLTASPGGHLTELLLFAPVYRQHDVFLISNDWPRVRSMTMRKYLMPLFSRNVLLLFPALMIAFNALWHERPQAVISTGAEVALPVFFIARILGIKTIFIETCTRFHNPTLTGRLAYWLSNRFYVQNKETLPCYGRRAEWYGGLL